MPSKRPTINWVVSVPGRLDALADRASQEATYITKSEFIRAAVLKFIKTLEPLSDMESDDDFWSIKVNLQFNERVEQAVKTGSFLNKAELIRAAVRREIQIQLPNTKL